MLYLCVYPFSSKPVIKPLFDQHMQGLKEEGGVKRKAEGETLMAKEFTWGSQWSYQKEAVLYRVCNKEILCRPGPVYQVPYGYGEQESTQFYLGSRLSESNDT